MRFIKQQRGLGIIYVVSGYYSGKDNPGKLLSKLENNQLITFLDPKYIYVNILNTNYKGFKRRGQPWSN